MMQLRINSKFIPLLITVSLFAALFAIGSMVYRGFFSVQVILNLFIDNAFLIIAALGETLIIIMGGIDLSVGALIALSTMITAYLLAETHMIPTLVIAVVLLVGSLFGCAQGYLITYRKFQPFIATLAGMFIARGLCSIISQDTITISDPFFVAASVSRIKFPDGSFVSVGVVIALIVLAIYVYLAHYTKFGRNVYAVGGSEASARLMGLPVDQTKMLAYTLSGFTSGVAGVVFTFYMLSGYGLHAMALEMDAIAGAVIGGTLMTGGVGLVVGTVFGVLIEGIIQTIITFQGTLNSWWTRIAIAFLLLAFIVVQRILVIRRESKKTMRPVEFIE